MTHGHEVLEMMQGHSYTETSLLEAIIIQLSYQMLDSTDRIIK